MCPCPCMSVSQSESTSTGWQIGGQLCEESDGFGMWRWGVFAGFSFTDECRQREWRLQQQHCSNMNDTLRDCLRLDPDNHARLQMLTSSCVVILHFPSRSPQSAVALCLSSSRPGKIWASRNTDWLLVLWESQNVEKPSETALTQLRLTTKC